MQSGNKIKTTVIVILPFISFMLSCTRNEVDFGTVPENSYTNLVYIDTVGVKLSTVIIDSFSTGNAQSFLLGKLKDTYLGLVSTQPFFELNKPTVPDIPDRAVYDSLTCIIRFNKYYSGDTTRQLTINVNELAQPIALSYNNLLYNTSRAEIKPVPLGTRLLTIRPNRDDSAAIRLDDAKGQELFLKLRTKADEVLNAESFLNYFRGMSLSTAADDTSVIYGIKDTVVMRLTYHYNNPLPQSYTVDFVSAVNVEAFNQILTDRSGTGLIPSGKGYSEIPVLQTNHVAYSQPGTGLYLKMQFPGLKGVILNENIVRLLKADLIVRPVRQSFDLNKFKLPSQLFLVQTDASNIPGLPVTSSSGGVLYANPVLDNTSSQDNYYSFDVTTQISNMLNTAGTEENGFFVIQGYAGSTIQVNRLVTGDLSIPGYTTQLRLSVLVIKQ